MLEELCLRYESQIHKYQDLQAASKHDLLAAILVELRKIESEQHFVRLNNEEMLKKLNKYLESTQLDDATNPSTP